MRSLRQLRRSIWEPVHASHDPAHTHPTQPEWDVATLVGYGGPRRPPRHLTLTPNPNPNPNPNPSDLPGGASRETEPVAEAIPTKHDPGIWQSASGPQKGSGQRPRSINGGGTERGLISPQRVPWMILLGLGLGNSGHLWHSPAQHGCPSLTGGLCRCVLWLCRTGLGNPPATPRRWIWPSRAEGDSIVLEDRLCPTPQGNPTPDTQLRSSPAQPFQTASIYTRNSGWLSTPSFFLKVRLRFT